MPPPFDALARRLNATVNGLLGEAFTLMPVARGRDVNAPPGPDLDRAEVAFTGTFIDPGARAGSGVDSLRAASIRKGNPGHTSDRPTVQAERRLFAVRPRQGDRLQRAATQETFVIAEILPAGSLYVFQLHR